MRRPPRADATTDVFLYASTPPDLRPDQRVATIGEVVGTPDLLHALARELDFPGYFGNNFDALEDCLRDLSWLPEPEAVIYHQQVPVLVRPDLRDYASILRQVIQEWEASGNERRLSVIFPTDSERVVRELLREWDEATEIWS